MFVVFSAKKNHSNLAYIGPSKIWTVKENKSIHKNTSSFVIILILSSNLSNFTLGQSREEAITRFEFQYGGLRK